MCWLHCGFLAFTVLLEIYPKSAVYGSTEEKLWRDKVCGFWIPSETSTPTGYVIETVTGERLGPIKTVFWGDIWNPNFSEHDTAFVHEVDVKLLVTGSVADTTEVALVMKTIDEMSSIVERREEWASCSRRSTDKRCIGENSQNPAMYDDVLKRVREFYPSSRVVDIYIVKKWISVNWW